MHTTVSKFASKPKVYQNLGFRDASGTNGDIVGFRMKLESVLARILDRESRNELRNEQRREEFKTKSDCKNQEIGALEEQIDRVRNEQIPEAEAAIEVVRDQIADMKANPGKYAEKHKDRNKLWALGVLSSCIAVFLILFYGSVIYSAFFRQISVEEASRLSSVIYQHAHRDAWNDGVFTFLMILLGPTVFLAISIYAHFKQFATKYGMWLVFGVTFLLDGLLAYHLARKLFEAKELNSFQAIPEYGILQALMDGNFWLVIAFGFIVYVFFSGILSLFEKERDVHAKFNRLLDAKESELAHKEGKRADLFARIDNLLGQVSALRLELAQMELDILKVKFSPGELRGKLYEYSLGWIRYIRQRDEHFGTVTEIEQSLAQFFISKGL